MPPPTQQQPCSPSAAPSDRSTSPPPALTTLQLTKCDEKKGAAAGIDHRHVTIWRAGSFRNGKVEILANAEGMRTTPSYVALSTGHERLVGDAAKNQAARNAREQFMMRND